VDRNRLKRRLREIVRVDVLPGLAAIDLVVRARPEAYVANMTTLRTEVVRGAVSLSGIARTE
jgi:ribonuclease P protein component